MRWTFAVTLALFAYLAQGEPPAPVVGQVTDENGACPMARVRIKGTDQTAETDKDGRFRIDAKGKRITAWKEGYFIAGADSDDNPIRLKLRRLPTEDNPDYAWVDAHPSKQQAMQCGNCHTEIYKEWSLSGHARAGKNPRFLNLYDGSDANGKPNRGWSLLKEHPDGASVCAACHAPTVPAEHAGFADIRKLEGVHASGVHCDYCHKIADAPLKRLGLEHGRYAYSLLRPKEGQLFFGPLDDVDRDEDTFSPLYAKSQYCASCHEGTIFGVKVYTTYSEWLESPAKKLGQQCQTCHMKPTGKLTNIAPNKGGIERDPATLASHAMPGGSRLMLERSLGLRVRIKRSGDAIELDTETMARGVGHRVPTGYIDRHVVLVIEALNAKGERIAPDKGSTLPSAAGKGDPGGFAELAGRFYGRILEDADGVSPIPFWRPPAKETDTRLFPDKADAGAWSFPAEGVRQFRVRLIYRKFFHSVAETKAWADNDLVLIDEKFPAPAEGRTVEWDSNKSARNHD